MPAGGAERARARLETTTGVEPRGDLAAERFLVNHPRRSRFLCRELEELLRVAGARVETRELGADEGHAQSEGLCTSLREGGQPVEVTCSARAIAGGRERQAAVIFVLRLFEEGIGGPVEQGRPGDRVKSSRLIVEEHGALHLANPVEGGRNHHTSRIFELANVGNRARDAPAQSLNQLQLPEQNLDDELGPGLARAGLVVAVVEMMVVCLVPVAEG